jgi:glycosyltransferase involved in cell wall biosynthesis
VKNDVTVCIPSIPPRAKTYLPKALMSVTMQYHGVDAIAVATDTERCGAWHARQRALNMSRTEWVQFLDDDDMLYPNHIEALLMVGIEEDADYVFSYWDLTRTPDILGHFGRVFDPEDPYHTTMTVLVKRELAQSVGFNPREPHHEVGGEDWRFTLGCVAAGAKIVHVPIQSWYWRHHGANTSGREDRW